MTYKSSSLQQPDDRCYGEVFVHLVKRHFGLPVDIDAAALAERAYLVTAAFDPVDLRLLRAERRAGKPDSAAGWVELDQLAQVYNILCRRLGRGGGHAGPWPYLVAGLELGCHGSRIFPRAEKGRRQVQAVLVLSDSDEQTGPGLLAQLQAELPCHRHTIIESISAVPIGDVLLVDAFDEAIWPVLAQLPGAAFRVFDRPTYREISKQAAATAARTRHRRLESERQLLAEVDRLMGRLGSSRPMEGRPKLVRGARS